MLGGEEVNALEGHTAGSAEAESVATVQAEAVVSVKLGVLKGLIRGAISEADRNRGGEDNTTEMGATVDTSRKAPPCQPALPPASPWGHRRAAKHAPMDLPPASPCQSSVAAMNSAAPGHGHRRAASHAPMDIAEPLQVGEPVGAGRMAATHLHHPFRNLVEEPSVLPLVLEHMAGVGLVAVVDWASPTGPRADDDVFSFPKALRLG